MRDPFAGYDQWKTASPYDDDPDECEHENLEHQAAQPERSDEPGCPEGFICEDCGEFIDLDEATRLGI